MADKGVLLSYINAVKKVYQGKKNKLKQEKQCQKNLRQRRNCDKYKFILMKLSKNGRESVANEETIYSMLLCGRSEDEDDVN